MCKVAKKSVRYRCGECGALSLTQVGRCGSCGSWGTMEAEEADSVLKPRAAAVSRPVLIPDAPPEVRIPSGIDELDRVLGGGWLSGGVVLLGGEPGVGKSTLLLQSCAAVSADQSVLYVSAEESTSQLAMRSRRLGLGGCTLKLLSTDSADEAVSSAESCSLVVFDSVQALRCCDAGGYPGSLQQVRAVADRIMDFSKKSGAVCVLVGHITKQGQIAGPKLLEHLVDVVLLFYGERTSRCRLLRAEKNRFGSTDELGVFEMGEHGLAPMIDASHLYWGGAGASVPGVAMGVCLEGTRPLVTEVQALSCPTPFPYPRRTARGIEVNRLHLLLAVLERRCGVSARNGDVYVNVAGGLNVSDPAADLAVCMALASSIGDAALGGDTCYIGEVGLAGEVRPVPRLGHRLKEAARLGFKSAVVSRRGMDEQYALRVLPVDSLEEAVRLVER